MHIHAGAYTVDSRLLSVMQREGSIDPSASPDVLRLGRIHCGSDDEKGDEVAPYSYIVPNVDDKTNRQHLASLQVAGWFNAQIDTT